MDLFVFLGVPIELVINLSFEYFTLLSALWALK